MIKWYQHLYLDQKAEKKIEKLKSKIEDGKISINLYCVCIASNEDNILDIMNVNELLFRHYARIPVYIVGLAYSKENALKLVEEIVLDIYNNTDEFNAREYFYTFLNN
ncbi:MAG: hypothetical protein Q4G58_07230 [bacterium]|nr:hypothetical protein [bacterium]